MDADMSTFQLRSSGSLEPQPSAYTDVPIQPDASAFTARIKGDSEYDWFKYTGNPMTVSNKAGNTHHPMSRGTVFGVRKSSNGKQIRLVFEELGLTKVFTLELSLAEYLAKNCKKA